MQKPRRNYLPDTTVHDRKEEFFNHVWDHTKDVDFFTTFTQPRELTTVQKNIIKEIICILCDNKSNNKEACDRIYNILKTQPTENNIIPIILQLIGSTRNKILTDLRAMLAQTNIPIPSKPENIVKNKQLLTYAEKYITNELRRVFASIIDKGCKVEDDALYLILDILNESTWSGFIRQAKAKRTGHYAEYRLATELEKIGIPFEPQSKLKNKPSADIKFNEISYDLIIPNTIEPIICIKATAHTANIGQYGESKDALEVTEAKNKISEMISTSRPLLLSLIDGIGFKSNLAGLTTILENVDEFVQFKTIWKIVILYAYKNNKKIKVWLPDPKNHVDFITKYSNSINLVNDKSDLISIGEGAVESIQNMK